MRIFPLIWVIVIAICIGIGIGSKAIAQEQLHLPFRQLSMEQGLSELSVYDIIQDKEGFIWAGTQEGLNKFDGYHFTIFKHDPADKSSISSSSVRAICEDKNGLLWLGTHGGGLNCFDKKTKKFEKYLADSGKPNTILSNNINCIFQDSKGLLWLGTEDGLCSFDAKAKKFTSYRHKNGENTSLSNDQVFSCYEDSKGRLWVGTVHGLNLLDRKTGRFKVYQGASFPAGTIIKSIYEDRANNIWVGSWVNGLYRWDEKQDVFNSVKMQDNNSGPTGNRNVNDIYEDAAGNLWLATYGGGLAIYNPKSGKLQKAVHDESDANSLADNTLIKFCHDRQGILWIATYGGGISYYDPNAGRFNNYRKNPADSNSLSGNGIINIFEDSKGLLWIGTWGKGLNTLDKKTGRFRHYYGLGLNTGTISSNIINQVTEDKEGRMWLATGGGGLNCLEKGDKKFKSYQAPNEMDPNHSFRNIYYLLPDENNKIWCGSADGGLFLFDNNTKLFKSYTHKAGDNNSLSHNTITFLYKSRDGIIWVGTWGGGLSAFDKKTGKFTAYKNSTGNSNSLSNNTVTCVYEDAAGLLWIGTECGLNILDRKAEKFRCFTQKDGLPNDVIYGVMQDKAGNYWMSTNNGISKLRWDGNKIYCKNYDTRDGLPSREFNSPAFCKGADGMMYYGGFNGFTSFMPEKISDNPYLPPVYFTDFQLFNKSLYPGDASGILKTNIGFAKEIRLNYDQNVFSFEFTALNYSNPEKNRYAYKMEGFDAGWIYTDAKKRFATYTNLDPGEYIFKVKASNNDGIWNEKDSTIKLIVTPPFYKTWWFLSLGILTILSGTFIAARYTSAQKYKKRLQDLERQKEIENIRGRIARDIHDDIGAELTKISLLAETSLSAHNPGDKNRNALEKLSAAARAITNNLGEIVWAINPQHDNLESLLSYYRNYALHFFEDTNIRCEINFPEELPAFTVNPDIRRNLFLILKEALNNSLKYSEADKVTISFMLNERNYILSISDNGKGIKEDSISVFGNGLKNMKTRINSISGDLEIISSTTEGILIKASGRIY